MQETTINERVKEIRHVFCRGDNKLFAEKTGRTEWQCSNWCSTGIVGNSIIKMLLEKFPTVNREWLENGVGDMVGNNVIQSGENVHHNNYNSDEVIATLTKTNAELVAEIRAMGVRIDKLIDKIK